MRRPDPDPVAAYAQLDKRGRRLVLYVALYRRRRGIGPTFREAAAAVGMHDPAARWPLLVSAVPCVTWEAEVPRSLNVAADLGPVLEPVLELAKKERTA
jgi:hypothetical protein